MLRLSWVCDFVAFLKEIESHLSSRHLDVSDLQKTLEKTDIPDFVKIIGDDWYYFGICMNVEVFQMKQIKADSQKLAEQVINFLDHLLGQETSMTYESFIFGFYQMTGGQNKRILDVLDFLANKLEGKILE